MCEKTQKGAYRLSIWIHFLVLVSVNASYLHRTCSWRPIEILSVRSLASPADSIRHPPSKWAGGKQPPSTQSKSWRTLSPQLSTSRSSPPEPSLIWASNPLVKIRKPNLLTRGLRTTEKLLLLRRRSGSRIFSSYLGSSTLTLTVSFCNISYDMIESRLVTPGVVDSFPEITKEKNYVDNLIWVSRLDCLTFD